MLPGMRIYKTNILIRGDVFRHFRSQLQVKSKIDLRQLGEFIFIGFGRWQAKSYRKRT